MVRQYAVLFDGFRSQNMVIYQDLEKDSIWYVHGHTDNAQDAHILAAGLNAKSFDSFD